MEPSQQDAGVRRDTAKVTAGLNKRYTLEAAERLRQFDRPTLFAWAPEDRFFKLSDAERLAEAIPDARIKTIPDAKTFVSLDQPKRLADVIAAFIEETSAAPAAASEPPENRRVGGLDPWDYTIAHSTGRVQRLGLPLTSLGIAGRRRPRAGSGGRPWR